MIVYRVTITEENKNPVVRFVETAHEGLAIVNAHKKQGVSATAEPIEIPKGRAGIVGILNEAASPAS